MPRGADVKTHTIRNKSGANPIVTLVPKFFDRCKSSYPEAFGMAFSAFIHQYKAVTGKTVKLDYEQQAVLQALAGADERGYYVSRFTRLPGVAYQMTMLMGHALERSASFSFEEALTLTQEFYEMLEARYPNEVKLNPAVSAEQPA